MRKIFTIWMVSIFVVSLFTVISSFSNAEVVKVVQRDFDGGEVGEVITEPTHINTTGDDMFGNKEGGLTLAVLARFGVLSDKPLLDADWHNGICALLYSDGVYMLAPGPDDQLDTLSIENVYSFANEVHYGIVSFLDNGEVFVATETYVPEGDDYRVTFRYYVAASIYSDFHQMNPTIYTAPVAAHLRIKANCGDYVIFGGDSFLARYDKTGITILEDTFVWPASVPEHRLFSAYYFRMEISGIEKEPIDYIARGFSFLKYGVEYYGFLPPSMFDSTKTHRVKREDIHWPGIFNEKIEEISLYYYRYIFNDLEYFPNEDLLLVVGDYGVIFYLRGSDLVDGASGLTIGRFTSAPLPEDYEWEVDQSIAYPWVACYGSFNGLRNAHDSSIVELPRGCLGLARHDVYGYMWVSDNKLYITENPTTGIYAIYDITDTSLYPPIYTSVMGYTGKHYKLYPDPTGNFVIVRSLDNTGVIELRNYTKDGRYIAAKYKLNMQMPGTDDEVIALLTDVEMYWEDDVPLGTWYTAYVSNDGGTTWEIYENGTRHAFSNVDPGHNTFTYKFVMHSDNWQRYTPTIYNLYFKLYVKYVPVVKGDIVPHLAVDADGNIKTYYETWEPVNFTAENTYDIDNELYDLEFEWNFGDPYAAENPIIPWPGPKNATSTMYNPNVVNGTWLWNATHIYIKPGTYTVTLNVTDGDFISSSATFQVTIHNRRPHAIISGYDNYALLEGETLTLDASPSWDFDGEIEKYEWIIGANEAVYTGQTISHTFESSGNRTVELWVTDDYGDENVTRVRVHVTPMDTYPEARFTVSSTRVQVGESITFTDKSTDRVGYIVNRTWYMGDGTVIYNKTTFTYAYEKPGRYTVVLYVTDNASQQTYTQKNIEVTVMPPKGDWIVTDHVVCDSWMVMMQGDIVVQNGGWLEVKNSNIIFMCQANGQYGIRVEEGGKLTSDNSAIGPWYHPDKETNLGVYNYFFFENYGTVYINASVIKGVDEDKSAYRHGITQYQDGKLYISTSSEIRDNEGFAVSVSSSLLYLGNSVIEIVDSKLVNSYGGVYAVGGNITLKHTNILNMYTSVKLFGGNMFVSNCYIRTGKDYGIYFYKGNLSVDNSTIAICGRAVDVYSTSLKFADNIVMGAGNRTNGFVGNVDCTLYRSVFMNAQRGVYAYAADVTVIDCTVKDNTMHYVAGSGGRVLVDNFLKVLVKWLGKPIDDASVELYINDELEYNDTTIKGYTGPYQLHYAIIMPSETIFPEYIVKVKYGGLNDARRIDMKTSHTEVFEFNPPKEEEEGAGGVTWFGEEVNWLWPVLIIGIIWAVIGFVWYKKRDDLEWREKYGKWLIIGGIAASVITWLWFFPPTWDISGIYPYAVVGGLWAAVGFVFWRYGDHDLIQEHKMKILIGTAILSLLLWLYFAGEILTVYILIMISILLGIVYFLIRSGRVQMPSLHRENSGQTTIGGALVIIFVIVLIALGLAWLMGLWYPGMFIGSAVSSAGEWVSETTGGWYPGKNVQEAGGALQDWWNSLW